MKKNSVILCISLVLGICASVLAADIAWDDGAPADHNWSSILNWNTGAVPESGDSAWMNTVQSASPTHPVIQVGDVVPASGNLHYMVVGHVSSPSGIDQKLEMNGGSVVGNVMLVGWNAPATTTNVFEMSGGTVDLMNFGERPHFWLGNTAASGPAYFTQTGGDVTTEVAVFGAGTIDGKANLLGGTFTTDELHMWNPSPECTINGGAVLSVATFLPQSEAVINIIDGAFILAGDQTASVVSWITAGNIVANGGAGEVAYDYDATNPGKTTVWRLAEPTVAHWRFEEGTDGVEHAGDQDDWYEDLSGNGNHMSSWGSDSRPMATSDRPFDPVPQTGQSNSLAVYFDKTDTSHDDLGTFGGTKYLERMAFDGGWTVEATFKLKERWDWQGIVGKDGQPNAGAAYQAFCYKTFPDGTLIVDYTDNNLDRHEIATGAGFLDLDTWYSVATTYDAATKTARFYVKAEGDADYGLIGPLTDSYGVSLGQEVKDWLVGRAMWDGSPANFADAMIDEVRISNVALDPSEFLNSDGDDDGNGLADAWEVQNLGSAGGNPYDDSDGDGLDDFTEYAYGGDPGTNDAAAIYPTVEWHENGDITYVYNRRLDATADTLAYDLVYKTNLLDLGWFPSGGTWETNTGPFNAEVESVSNYVPFSVYAETFPEAFVKLLVEDVWKSSVFSQAKNPVPADGEDNAEDDEDTLSWDAVSGATEYMVYFGTNETAVAAGDASMLVSTQTGTTFDASALIDIYKNYFWRIVPVGSTPDTVFMPSLVWSFKQTIPAELGRGHKLFLKHGFLSGAVVFPNDFGFSGATVNNNIDWDTWSDAGFNSVCTHSSWINDLTGTTGPTDNTYWRWCEGQTELSDGSGNGTVHINEINYMDGVDNLVALQAADEEDLNDTGWRNAIKAAFDRWKVAYPDTLVYTTQNGPSNEGGIRSFQEYAKPDMAYMFTYEFYDGGGSVNKMYKSCRDFREWGKQGIGATIYDEPIPYGMYFQAMNIEGNRHVGLPEMCLGMFAPVAYGYKAINAFVYARNSAVAPENTIRAELFEDGGDTVRRELFDVAAENNRQILLMGDSLVRLSNEGVWDLNGESGEIPDWTNGNIPNLSIASTGEMLVSHFRPLHEAFDGPGYSNQDYFFLLNAIAPVDGYPEDHADTYTLTIGGGITALESINLTTGAVETLPVTGGTVAVTLDGGRGKLFKFATGAPFVGFYNGE